MGHEAHRQGKFLQMSELPATRLVGRAGPSRGKLHPLIAKGSEDCTSSELHLNTHTCRCGNCHSRKSSWSGGGGSVRVLMKGQRYPTQTSQTITAPRLPGPHHTKDVVVGRRKSTRGVGAGPSASNTTCIHNMRHFCRTFDVRRAVGPKTLHRRRHLRKGDRRAGRRRDCPLTSES